MTGITDMVVVIKLRNKEGIIGKGREGRKERKRRRMVGGALLHFFNGLDPENGFIFEIGIIWHLAVIESKSYFFHLK